ncbi:MAG: hypothetical protein ABIQ18_36835 [Umezawaea sp.]
MAGVLIASGLGMAQATPAEDVDRTRAAAGWNPPANLITPLNQVWAHQESTYSDLYGFRNYGWDPVFANRGYLNFCVRWDSPASVSAAEFDKWMLRDWWRHLKNRYGL